MLRAFGGHGGETIDEQIQIVLKDSFHGVHSAPPQVLNILLT
jgi:hypothetical protein